MESAHLKMPFNSPCDWTFLQLSQGDESWEGQAWHVAIGMEPEWDGRPGVKFVYVLPSF